ncbi:MAG TPA: hypothetical protein VFP49_08630 [Nitrososphaeraceae archaeon]|nr:hypothetical protein [Nitrososphaeraceae archaeon]
MVNVKEENKKQSNNIKEETNKFLYNQRQQLENTISTISESTNKINDNINEYQKTNKAILEKSVEISNKYQQQAVNTIQSISNNYIELQNNILNAYQSTFSRFLDDVSNKSNWNNFKIPERYADVYNKTKQNMTDHTINCTQKINEFVLGSTENFNKSIEIVQKYYNDNLQNYFNFVNKIGKSYYNQ